MVRKTVFGAAAMAATLLITFAGAEGSGALAQVVEDRAPTIANEERLTEEVVPTFVQGEVVQPLPQEDESATGSGLGEFASLRELVAATSVDAPLSDQLRCLAGAIYFESRGEPLDGQLAVAQVIINRTESGQFPSSYCSVVYQPHQFSFVKRGRMPAIKTSSQAWKNAKAIAHIAHRGEWDSEARDSLFFHAKYVSPSWSRRKVARATIQTHIFYR